MRWRSSLKELEAWDTKKDESLKHFTDHDFTRNRMGNVDVCLKRGYITVASVIGIVSALLLAITVFSHGYVHEQEEMLKDLQIMYIISIVTLLLTIIGVFGAWKKKKWALISFTVGMILSSLFMFVCESNGLAMKPEVAEELKRQYLNMGLLSNTSWIFKGRLKEAQMELQCCGLDQGYVDWGYDIPESCMCTEESTNPCVAAPRDSILFEHSINDEPIMIYKEPCLQYLIAEEMIAVNIALGLMLGVTLLWVLSVVLCILILCRLDKKGNTPAVVYSPEAKAGNYTTLTESVEFT
ncbi:tetraspanin-8-like isoform X1 [Xiphias gladius]|uniref:tetraspanin-8-like isoform X1 n=1 Tax=Xiphias gladius TaxID=8245 RepID=UPI001A988B3B|nr:tetraspanin-8-like isoform X1 [Xiphias gladius]